MSWSARTDRTNRSATRRSRGRIVSLLYQPPAMRWRGVAVITNTPPRRAQSQPGGMQGITLMEPLLAKAARKLAVDQVAIRRMNAPEGKAVFGPASPQGARAHATSAFIKEALDRGGERFKWDERKATTGIGKRQGTRVRGVGVAVSTFVAGSVGFDGLFIIKPDGRMYIQSGIGNLGTESMSDTHRVAAEMVGMPWEKCEVTWGQHEQEPALVLCLRRQPDDARAYARRACGRHRRDQQAAADCRERSRRQTRGLRGGERARVPQGRRRRHDAREGGLSRHRARRDFRRS